jgi:tRNA G10  N-methylase Trm11
MGGALTWRSQRSLIKKKRIARGESTTNVLMSATVGGNAEIFPKILSLHVAAGSTIADVTYGQGVFWSKVTDATYNVLASDIFDTPKRAPQPFVNLRCGIDCRNLPYDDNSLDCAVLDPPYMESFYRDKKSHRGGGGNLSAFQRYYTSGSIQMKGSPKWHDAVTQMYCESGVEAYRVLQDSGIFIVKCQDEVSANKQRLTHIEIVTAYESLGFYSKDIFIVVQNND